VLGILTKERERRKKGVAPSLFSAEEEEGKRFNSDRGKKGKGMSMNGNRSPGPRIGRW